MKNLKLLKNQIQIPSEDSYYIRKTLDPNLVRDFDEHKKRYKSVLDQIHVKNDMVPDLSENTTSIQTHYSFVVDKVVDKKNKNINLDDNFGHEHIISCLKDDNNLAENYIISPFKEEKIRQYSIDSLKLSHEYQYLDVKNSLNNVLINKTENVDYNVKTLNDFYLYSLNRFRVNEGETEANNALLTAIANDIFVGSTNNAFSSQQLSILRDFWTSVSHGISISESVTLLMLDQNLLITLGAYSYTIGYHLMHEPQSFRYVVDKVITLSKETKSSILKNVKYHPYIQYSLAGGGIMALIGLCVTLDVNGLVTYFVKNFGGAISFLIPRPETNVNVPALTVGSSISTDEPVNPFVVIGAKKIGSTLGAALKGFFESLSKGWKTN